MRLAKECQCLGRPCVTGAHKGGGGLGKRAKSREPGLHLLDIRILFAAHFVNMDCSLGDFIPISKRRIKGIPSPPPPRGVIKGKEP